MRGESTELVTETGTSAYVAGILLEQRAGFTRRAPSRTARRRAHRVAVDGRGALRYFASFSAMSYARISSSLRAFHARRLLAP